MQRLSDFIVIDFCEWLKKSILSKEMYSNIDMWDLLFDDKYEETLLIEAQNYCDKKETLKEDLCPNPKDSVKMIINEYVRTFCDSDEFNELYYPIRRPQGWEYYINDVKKKLFRKLGKLFRELENNIRYSYYDTRNISPYRLIDDVRYCYRERCNNNHVDTIIDLMIASKPIEIDFIEWIKQENIGKESVEKIDLMPIDVFEEYAFRFCKDTGYGEEVKRRLVKSFKRSEPGSLLSKISEWLPCDNAYRKRNLRYISQRYLENKAIYKCVLLPIEADCDKFRELVTKRWKDLNDTSADYLDIYYSFANYGESGQVLKNQLHYLPNQFHAKLPCIALWKENMEDAKCISINELSVEDVYYMIAGNGGIVDLIVEGKTINEIVEGVNNMGEERRNKERPFYKYVQSVNGSSNVQQSMVLNSSGVSVSGNFSAENTDLFMKEIDEAIRLVVSSELEDALKKHLQSILEDAKEGIQKNNEDKVKTSIASFKTFVACAGNAAQKLIATLAGLSTIANFFGIHISS